MIFEETQHFRQQWLWIILIITSLLPIGIFGSGIYFQIIKGRPFGTNPMSDTQLIIFSIFVFGLMGGTLLLFGSLHLKTIIDEAGISYKFFPFQTRFRFIPWDEIESYEVVKYSPIKEYGGWGIRFGKEGRAYNVSGDRGLKIQMKNGKKILIGTRKEDELKNFLNTIR